MRKEYEFSKMKGRRNPYANLLKKPVTIRLGADVVEYFKSMASELAESHESLPERLRSVASTHSVGRAFIEDRCASHMKRIALSDVKDGLSKYLHAVEREEIVITRHGKPAGILIGFASEDAWFDYRLGREPRFLPRLGAAR